MNFGGIKASTSIKNLNAKRSDPLLIDHFDGNSRDYFLFLVDRITENQKILDLIKKDISIKGINSYVVVSCITVKRPAEDATDKLPQFESNWRKYINYKGKECSAIVAFGRAVRLLNKSADILPMHFEDDYFMPHRYFCGSRFVGGPDKWIYPVEDIDKIYPVEELKSTDCVNWYTRIFRKRLEYLLKDDFSTSSLDMREIIQINIGTEDDCKKMLDDLMDSELLAIDTETSGFDHWRDSLGTFQLCNDGVHSYFVEWSLLSKFKRSLKKCLSSAKRLTLANGKFDIKWLYVNGIKGVEPTDDTTLLSHAMNSNVPKGLKPGTWIWCGNYGGYDDMLDMLKKKMKIDNYLKIPKEVLSKYAAIDPAVTWRQQVAMDAWCKRLDERFPNEKIPEWTIYRFYKEIMIPNLLVNIETEVDGVFFNPDKFAEVDATLKKICDDCIAEMSQLWKVDKNFKFSSTDELGKLFEKLGWPDVGRNAKGFYKTDDASLNEYERLGCPGIPTLRRFRSMNVGRNTFIKGWGSLIVDHTDGTHRVHSSCNSFGTSTFRHSMNDPNFQQIPARGQLGDLIKSLFCSPPSHVNYEVTDDNGKVWDNKIYCRVITERGPVLFEDLTENDMIIDYDKTYTVYEHLPTPWYAC